MSTVTVTLPLACASEIVRNAAREAARNAAEYELDRGVIEHPGRFYAKPAKAADQWYRARKRARDRAVKTLEAFGAEFRTLAPEAYLRDWPILKNRNGVTVKTGTIPLGSFRHDLMRDALDALALAVATEWTEQRKATR